MQLAKVIASGDMDGVTYSGLFEGLEAITEGLFASAITTSGTRFDEPCAPLGASRLRHRDIKDGINGINQKGDFLVGG